MGIWLRRLLVLPYLYVHFTRTSYLWSRVWRDLLQRTRSRRRRGRRSLINDNQINTLSGDLCSSSLSKQEQQYIKHRITLCIFYCIEMPQNESSIRQFFPSQKLNALLMNNQSTSSLPKEILQVHIFYLTSVLPLLWILLSLSSLIYLGKFIAITIKYNFTYSSKFI